MTTKIYGINWKALLVLFFFLCSIVVSPAPQASAAAGAPYLVKDLYAGTTSSSPSSFYFYNNQLIFRAKVNDTTYGVYSTDGTDAGTKLITPLTSASPFMLTYGISGYENYLGALAFSSEQTLYMSQGTAETLATFDFFAPLYYHPWKISAIKAVKDKLFFIACGADESTTPYTYRVQLWAVTDRVVSHAHLVKNIFSQPNDLINGNPTMPKQVYAVGNLLYFFSKTGAGTWELWRSDGTPDGTFKVSDGSIVDQSNAVLVEYHGRVYFRGGDETLWSTDGTVAGTHQVFDHKDVYELKVIADRLYFTATTGEKDPKWGYALHGIYSSDGTTAGTQHLSAFDAPIIQLYILSVNGKAMVSDRSSLWAIDENGAAQDLYIPSGPSTIDWSSYNVYNGFLYFSGDSTSYPVKSAVWRTDGTPAGTGIYLANPSNNASLIIGNAYLNNGLLYFIGNDPATGSELWAADTGEAATPCSYEVEIPFAECQVLVGLYNSTGGPNWSNRTNWLTSSTPSNWSGVGISGGHITSLNLSNNHLVGDLPNELTGLTQLKSLDLSYNSLTVPQPYPSNPPTALQAFLAQKDPDWYMTQPISDTLDANGGDLTSNDGKAEVSVPTGALTSAVTLNYIPQPAPQSQTGNLAFAHTSFRLEANDGSENPPSTFAFSKPITVTLSYTDQDVTDVDEKSMLLYYWDTGSKSWKDASTTCSPHSTYTRDEAKNTITVDVCHLTEFALLGDPLYKVQIPLVLKH